MEVSFEALQDLLNRKAEQYNHPDFIPTDPIQLPHRFSKKEDIEIAGFLVATIAWGNRKSIITSGERILEIMDNAPYDFIRNHEESDLRFVHRTFNQVDLTSFFVALQRLYAQGGMENAFAASTEIPGVLGRINHFREQFTQEPFPSRTQKHIANPLKGSSAKRINMFLRWMVRSDNKGVDFGIWKTIPSAELHVPLDVHTGNVARKLGILERTQNDWKAVAEIQEHLIQFDPEDPSKYDFALFGLGAFEGF